DWMATRSIVAFLLEAEALADRGEPRAEGAIRSLLPARPVEGHALLARYLLRRGRRAESLAELERALVEYRRDPWPWPDFMARVLELVLEEAHDAASARRLLPAVSEPFAVGMLEASRRGLCLQLAYRAGGDACRAAYRALEPNPVWEEEVLRDRARCYRRTGDPLAQRAARDLQWFVDHRAATLPELLRSRPAPPAPQSR